MKTSSPHAAFTWELGSRLPELLALGHLSADSFFAKGKDWISEFLDDLPRIAVQSALTLQTDKNGNRAWTPNDMHDIDALAAAVPYCDVVVTEKYACEVMNRSGLAKRYATTVIRQPGDLNPILEALVDPAPSGTPSSSQARAVRPLDLRRGRTV